MIVNRKADIFMKFKVDDSILLIGHNFIPFENFKEIVAQIVQEYKHSSPTWWMWKAFEFGYVYGKRAERARRKGGQQHEG